MRCFESLSLLSHLPGNVRQATFEEGKVNGCETAAASILNGRLLMQHWQVLQRHAKQTKPLLLGHCEKYWFWHKNTEVLQEIDPIPEFPVEGEARE
jgi:hypothetical protein